MRVAGEGDLFIAVGTTLQVFPVASAVPIALDAGAQLLIINAEATQFDDVADAVIRAPIGEVLPRLCVTNDI
jgi:NAD-dependent deacetylase